MALLPMLKAGLKSFSVARSVSSIWLVLGNESCDLDSAVSSLVYSLLLCSEKKLSYFILNCNREDYELKTEVLYWFKKHGITQDYIIFRDDATFSSNKEALILSGGLAERSPELNGLVESVNSNSVSLCLVDHHILAARDSSFKCLVKEIIDHRPLEHTQHGDINLSHAIVGSCCTLITEKIAQRSPSLLRSVAPLLQGCILVDTVNCLPAAGRTTPRDIAALDILESNTPEIKNRDAVYKELLAVKSDVSMLTASQLLRRDMKVMGSISVSALPHNVKVFLSRSDCLSSLEEHGSSYSVVVVMGLSIVDDVPHRDLAVYCPDSTLLQKICDCLASSDSNLLGLEEETHLLTAKVDRLKFFQQRNGRASRKQVMPMIKAFISRS